MWTLQLKTAVIALWTLLFSCVVLSQQTSELQDIQQQIKQKQQAIEAQLADAKALESALKSAELEISNTAKALNHTQITLENNKQQQKQLEGQKQTLTKQQKQQQTLLARQLRSAFMAGNYDYAKMLFNQEDAGKFERVLSYYQYLNKARQTQISAFQQLVAELQTGQCGAANQTNRAGTVATAAEASTQRPCRSAKAAKTNPRKNRSVHRLRRCKSRAAAN